MQDDHFVSEFLLKPFTVNGYLQVYNKKIKKRIKPKTPGQVCYLRGFTTFAKDSVPPGWDEHFLEKELLKWENVIVATHKYNQLKNPSQKGNADWGIGVVEAAA